MQTTVSKHQRDGEAGGASSPYFHLQIDRHVWLTLLAVHGEHLQESGD